jgi:hypothetical protein
LDFVLYNKSFIVSLSALVFIMVIPLKLSRKIFGIQFLNSVFQTFYNFLASILNAKLKVSKSSVSNISYKHCIFCKLRSIFLTITHSLAYLNISFIIYTPPLMVRVNTKVITSLYKSRDSLKKI